MNDTWPNDADLYGITGTTPQLDSMERTINFLTMQGKVVMGGGPHATVCPNELLNMGASFVVQGEGEYILRDMAHNPFANYPNQVFRAPRIEDLDSLPFPDREQVSRYTYYIPDRHGNKHGATTMITSRGCSHHCSFCSHAVWGKFYRERSAENVLGEVRHIKDLGYDAVHFFDDSMCINTKRLLAICDGIKQLGMIWRCFVRADQVTPRILKAMANAGCVEIGIGIESGSQKVLDAIHKGETVEMQAIAIEWARYAGIRSKAFVIIGLPGEDWQSVDDTIAFLKQTRPDELDVTTLQIMPGSPIYGDPTTFGITRNQMATWYKGRRGEYVVNHRTEALDADDLLVARDYIDARFRKR